MDTNGNPPVNFVSDKGSRCESEQQQMANVEPFDCDYFPGRDDRARLDLSPSCLRVSTWIFFFFLVAYGFQVRRGSKGLDVGNGVWNRSEHMQISRSPLKGVRGRTDRRADSERGTEMESSIFFATCLPPTRTPMFRPLCFYIN